jgi:hypothetical protein
MATTTKSSKAKTKTSKAKKSAPPAKSVKTSKKTTSAKVTKKDTAKVVSKSTTKTTIKSPNNPTSALTKLYSISVAVYVAIAGAAFFLMNNASYQLSVGYWGKDQLKSVNGTQFAPATQGIVDIEVKWIVMALAIASLVLPILYLTKLKAENEKSLKNKIMPSRWIEMAFLSAIMIETVGILSGVLDIATLKVMGALMVVTMILGWIAEKRTAKVGGAAVREYYLSVLTGLLPWVIIASYAFFTMFYGELRSQWFVYVLYGIMLIGAALIGRHQLSSLKGEGKLSSYEAVEQKYATLSLVLRTTFAVVLIVGFLAK